MLSRRGLPAVLAPAVILAGLAWPVVGSTSPGMAASRMAAVPAQRPVPGSMVELAIHGVDVQAIPGLVGRAGERSRPGLLPAIATRQIPTDDFGLVGVTMGEAPPAGAQVRVRVREQGSWSAWEQLELDAGHGPDPGSPEADGIRVGTEPLLTGPSDAVQVRVDTPTGRAPRDTRIVLLDNPATPADAKLPMPDEAVTGRSPGASAQAATLGAPMPAIITRAQWGADESKRSRAPYYSGTIKAAFIHHTASTNDYTPEQAAQQVRNLYKWFTSGLHYSDMAYNFLIDRYGRLYEGRAGGMELPVVGGHTAGFNQDTFAVSAIGDFRRFRPNGTDQAAIDEALASLLAWKLSLYHRDPSGTTTLVSDSSAGTSKYSPGQSATAEVIGGHGDIGSTSCPGAVMHEQIPAIRAMAASKAGVAMFNPNVAPAAAYGTPEPVTVSASTTAPLAWSMTVRSKCGDVVRTVTGQQAASGALAIGWDKRDDAGNLVPPGAYTLSVTGASGNDGIYPWTGTARILPTADSPADPCGAPAEFVLTGAGYGHAVGMSQWGAYGMAKQGFAAPDIATFYYPGTSVTPVQDDMDIRVNLLYQVRAVKAKTEALEAGGGAIEVTTGATVVTGTPDDTFDFAVRDGAVVVTKTTAGQAVEVGTGPTATVRWAGTRVPGSAAGAATLLDLVGTGTSLNTSGHRYRHGFVEITPVSTSSGVRLNAVNSVRVHDEYLQGISEVSSAWPDAAQQAQVLAARTYALSKIARGVRQACGCHVDDGAGPYYDQTFTGWAKASAAKGDRWLANVAATAASDTTGLAILYDGKPISAFYSASNGGATQAVKDEWGGDLPYLPSVPDPYSLNDDNPNKSWTLTVPQAKMAAAFGTGEVWKVDVTERYASGAAKTLTASLPDGTTVTRTGSQLRSALGLKSIYLTAISGGTVVDSPVSPAAPAPAPVAPVETPAPAAPAAPEVKARTVSLLSPAAVTVAKGAPYKVVGIVRPAKPGLHAWRQVSVNGEWKTLQKGTTTKKGRYAFAIAKAKGVGTQSYRVLIVRKKTVVGVSPEFSVTVQPRQ